MLLKYLLNIQMICIDVIGDMINNKKRSSSDWIVY